MQFITRVQNKNLDSNSAPITAQALVAQWEQNTRQRKRLTKIAALLLILPILGPLLGASECRFGNRVEKAPAPPNPDTVSGFYQTEPDALFYASGITEAGEIDTAAQADLSLIPPRFLNTFTKPTYVAMDAYPSLTGVFAPNTLKSPLLPMELTEDRKTISYSKTISQGAAWTSDPSDPNYEAGCVSTVVLQFDGDLSLAEGLGTFTPPAPSTAQSIIGNMTLVGQYWRVFVGCAQTMAFMERCYLDETQCGYTDTQIAHASHLGLQSFFGPYVATNALRVEDISELKTLAYEVDYSPTPGSSARAQSSSGKIAAFTRALRVPTSGQ